MRPDLVFFDGDLVPWDAAVLPAWSEATLRAASAFEGVKAYRQARSGELAMVALHRHFLRLQRSARILRIAWSMGYPAFRAACWQAAGSGDAGASDLYLRHTIFAVEPDTSVLMIAAFPQPATSPAPLRMTTSTWRRPADDALPARAKAAANYQISRLARLEASLGGRDDAVLLNSAGRVAEATGAAVLIEHQDEIIAPPPSEGGLPSITVELVSRLGRELGIALLRQPVERSELYVADAIALCGTLHELVPVVELDGLALSHGEKLVALRQGYLKAARGGDHAAALELDLAPHDL